MKIVPFGINDNSKGQPVDVIGIVGGNGKWEIRIQCDEDNPHTLSLDNGRLELSDHTPDDAKGNETLLKLGKDRDGEDLDAIVACVKIKIWHRDSGLTIIEDIIP